MITYEKRKRVCRAQKTGIEVTKICARVLHMHEEEVRHLSVLEQIKLLDMALPLMTPEQKRKVKDLMEAPRRFWAPGPEKSFAV